MKNFVPAISVEGFEEATDCRRGNGTYQKVVHAMDLLKSHSLPFGISTCYTSANIEDVSTEAYIDQLVELGRLLRLVLPLHARGQGRRA